MSEKQAVADQADAPGKPETEAGGAQEQDLDTLLNEYDEGSGSKTEPGQQDTDKPADPSKVDAAISWIEEKRKQEAYDAVVKTAKEIQGDLPISEDLAIGFLHARASRDPRIEQAYISRQRDPAKWGKVLKALKSEFSKQFESLPDRQLTDDRAAVASAVRGASTPAPEADEPEWLNDAGNLSDAEFERRVASLGKK